MNADFEKRPESAVAKARRQDNQASGSWTIHDATLENLHELVALEDACFSVPWSRKSFEAELSGNQFSRVLIIHHPEYGQKFKSLVIFACGLFLRKSDF